MVLLASILALALTRAEMLERLRAPVVTQAGGLVKVYAACPEDMRREFQMPVASYAAETVKTLQRGLRLRPERVSGPAILVYVGDVRTNDTDVIARVSTNGAQAVTRIYLKSPGYADLERYRLEVVRGFFRGVCGEELTEAEAVRRYRAADPRLRIADVRAAVAAWWRGEGDAGGGPEADAAALRRIRQVIEPGVASADDVLTYASRLILYTSEPDLLFRSGRRAITFREAIAAAPDDPFVGVAAREKANHLALFGMGRGEKMNAAVRAHVDFLVALAESGEESAELTARLDDADRKLAVAFDGARTGRPN